MTAYIRAIVAGCCPLGAALGLLAVPGACAADSRAADEPPAHLQSIGTAVKRDAKGVAAAAKEGARHVAVAAKEVAHQVAAATKQGAGEVADAAKHGAAKAKAAVKGTPAADPAGKPAR